MTKQQGLETLSKRAAENVLGVDYWEPLVAAYSDPWSPSNPNGISILGIAENALMHDEVRMHLQNNASILLNAVWRLLAEQQSIQQFQIEPDHHFTYGNGPQGSPRLRAALASFFNSRFHPLQPTTAKQFILTTGVTALIDHVSWCICADGEAILFPQPLYAGFTNDVPHRARGKLVPVPFTREDGRLDLNDVFDLEANIMCFERAYRKCVEEGINVRGVMMTNPHNPLGKCYPVDTTKAIAAFCSKHELHLLSDEIYAMSTFVNAESTDATPFTSVLSIPLDEIIDPQRVHVLYGMSKDFCSNGLRLGTMHSRNPALRAACAGIAAFSWQAYLVQDMWARILEDQSFLDSFIAENQGRLAARYKYTANFLRENGFSFFEGGNAGFFIWIDLRNLMRKREDAGNTRAMTTASPAARTYEEREQELGQTWWKKGVMINSGIACLAEEYGWCRIIFTVDEDCLRVGLQRFVDGVREVEALWNT